MKKSNDKKPLYSILPEGFVQQLLRHGTISPNGLHAPNMLYVMDEDLIPGAFMAMQERFPATPMWAVRVHVPPLFMKGSDEVGVFEMPLEWTGENFSAAYHMTMILRNGRG